MKLVPVKFASIKLKLCEMQKRNENEIVRDIFFMKDEEHLGDERTTFGHHVHLPIFMKIVAL